MSQQTNREYELLLNNKGYTVIGVDEAGRGCLAGELVVSACILPTIFEIVGIKDSKKISDKQRRVIYNKLIENTKVKHSIMIVDIDEIDKLNILNATMLGMKEAIHDIIGKNDPNDYIVLIDGNKIPDGLLCKAESVVKGDNIHTCIASASILSKVYRDDMMITHSKKYVGWDFDKHKGYGTKSHMNKIKNEKIWTDIHRKTFAPVKNLVKNII